VTNNYEKPQFSDNLAIVQEIHIYDTTRKNRNKILESFIKVKEREFFPFSLRTAELRTSVTSFDF
jgi:hypothetical protein